MIVGTSMMMLESLCCGSG